MAHSYKLILTAVLDKQSVFVLVKEEIFFSGIIGPNVLNTLINLAIILYFLQVLNYLKWQPRACGIVYQLIFCCWPGCIFQL